MKERSEMFSTCKPENINEPSNIRAIWLASVSYKIMGHAPYSHIPEHLNITWLILIRMFRATDVPVKLNHMNWLEVLVKTSKHFTFALTANGMFIVFNLVTHNCRSVNLFASRLDAFVIKQISAFLSRAVPVCIKDSFPNNLSAK